MTHRQLPSWMTPFVTGAIHASARWVRPLTIGVRAIIIDETDRVFLVRHSYVRGWHLPGGAVEPGETVSEGLCREIREEANIEIGDGPILHGVFFNRHVSRRDHVLVYLVRRFRTLGAKHPDLEIVDSGFYPTDALPEGATAATRSRLNEVMHGAPLAQDW